MLKVLLQELSTGNCYYIEYINVCILNENTGLALKCCHRKLKCFVRKTVFNQVLSVCFIIIIYIFGSEYQLNSYLTSCYLEGHIFCGKPEVIKKISS